ncbi:MAG: hypothetical protein AMJ62_07385 [Myxococcales bacterium SG8_38]|nr:MAG: hypothetical protein AMJ62_07385 [Myxococcales bacterium SG8_38]
MLPRRLLVCAILPIACLASGCNDRDLGECNLGSLEGDEDGLPGPKAFDLVYNSIDGRPMFEGQALVQASCGNGSFCHAPSAVGAGRIGVPAGLDFDVQLACTDPSVDPTCANLQPCEGAGAQSPYCERLERLQSNRDTTASWGGDIMNEIRDGTMPPGAAGEQVQNDTPWIRPNLTELPRLDTKEGRDIVRNWLACGAPVVARTEIAPTPQNELAPCQSLEDEVCVYSGPQGDLPDPTWSSIYWSLIFTQCVTCHGPANSNLNSDDPNPANPLETGTIPGGASPQGFAALDLTGSDPADTSNWPSESHGALVDVPASAAGACEGPGVINVIPTDGPGSLMIQKMRAEQTCGREMPLGSGTQTISNAVIAVVEQWINAGAPND